MRGPSFWATIRAPYLQDFVNEHSTRADSGVEISFLDSSGRAVTRLTADRMVLEQPTDQLHMAGSVVIVADDSLVARSDSLLWNRDQDIVTVPGIVDVALPSGTMRGRQLATASRFDRWTAQDIRLQWQTASDAEEPDGGDETYDFELTARRADSQRLAGKLVARYDTVSARVEGNTIHSTRAIFDEGDGLILFSGGVEIEDGERSIRADEVEYELHGGKLRARGGVEVAVDEEGAGEHLAAEEITYAEDGERWNARGHPARLTMAGARSLEADRLRYQREEDLFTAAPKTVFMDGERVLEADSLVFLRGQDRLDAVGGIVLRAPEFSGVATASTASFDLAAEQVRLAGYPELRRARDSGDSLALKGAELSFDLATERISGRGGFHLAAGDLLLTAKAGGFDSASEVAEFVGDVELALGTPGSSEVSRVLADSMALALSEGEVTSIDLPNGLAGTIRTGGPGASWIKAPEGSIFLSREKLSRVELDGDADVTYRNSETGSVSRFQARSMSLAFDERGTLDQVTAEGGATVVSRLPEDGGGASVPSAGGGVTPDETGGTPAHGEAAMNTVQGERLEILLDDGEVVEVRVIESIEGTYTPLGDGPVSRRNGKVTE